MRVVFIGSGDIGEPSLAGLLGSASVSVTAVVTQPDRAAGRGLKVSFSRIKQLALGRGIPVLQPAKLRDPSAVAAIADLAPDLLVVMAYGQILPQALLDVPALGALNLHASLLPRHRGAAPVHAALLAGDATTGVTAMWMDAGLDTGDILCARECAVLPDDTAGSLHDRLGVLAAAVLEEALGLIAAGRAPRIPQDASRATYAGKLDRGTGRVDWRQSAAAIALKVRALHPWPGSTMEVILANGNREVLKVHRVAAEDGSADAGALLDGLRVGCGGGGVLRVLELQPPGGRRLTADEFLRGHPVAGVAV